MQEFVERRRRCGDAGLLEQVLVVEDNLDIVAVRQRIHIVVEAVVIEQAGLIGILQPALVDHIVQRSEQTGIDEWLHLRSGVHHRNIGNFLGRCLGLQLHLLLVSVQRIQFNVDIGVLLLVLADQLAHHLVIGCRRVRVDVLKSNRNLLAAISSASAARAWAGAG
ncbi:hypothetical protein D3C71_1619670 [compost metagenome]